MAHLFTPKQVGAYTLSHRVVLAPMTRLRTIQPDDIPSPMMADFYGQRASKDDDTLHEGHPPVAVKYLRPDFPGPIIAAGGFDGDSAEAVVASGDADLVAFGRHFTSNPDLPYRLKHRLALTPYVRAAFWGGTERNYSDFPTYEAAVHA